MEQKMTVKDAIFRFKQWMRFALDDEDRDLTNFALDIYHYSEFLFKLSVLDDVHQMIIIHENPMGGFYYTKCKDEYEGEI